MSDYKTLEILSPDGLVPVEKPLEKNDLIVIDGHIRGYVEKPVPLIMVTLDEDAWEEARKKFAVACQKTEPTVSADTLLKLGLRGAGAMWMFHGRRRHDRRHVQKAAGSLARIFGRGRKRRIYH